MKRIFFILLISLFLIPYYCIGEDFLGVPIIPNSKIIVKNNKRVEFLVNLSHDQVLRFYKDAFKGYKDIRIREWKDSTYIEDDGNRKWHSVNIYRVSSKEGTKVVIKKDSWTWILGTLLLRYIGVFVVLMTLLLVLSIAGRITSTLIKRIESK